ncbi:MAG: hypothetical protein DMG01_13865 [Acidobacteria bacterium]|nr:MAG: hypothetical protein DMG01_13865 [Acidobacteriota bacterium]
MVNRVVCFVGLVLFLCAVSPARAAIGIDVSTSANNAAVGTTIATPAFSTSAPNELLLAFVASDAAFGTTASVTNVAGGGLAWALVVRTNVQLGTAEIWRAFAPATLSNVAVTATLSQPVVSSVTVMSFTGTDTTGVNGAAAIGATASANAPSGAPAATLVTTRSNSLVLGVGDDWDSPIARTPAAGQSIVHQSLSTTGDTYWVQKMDATTPLAGTAVTVQDVAPTTDRFNLSIVEVLAGGGATTPPATWSIGGSISPAANASGTTVTLSGAAAASTTVDVNGNYSFSGLANGSYTVTPAKAAFSFTPASQPITINGASAAAINFSTQAVTASPIRLVQKAVNGNEGSVFSISATFPAGNTAGNFLIVTGAAARPAGTITISDTAGNTYLPAIGPVTDPGQDTTAYLWYVPSAKGGPNTVTLTPTSARALEIHLSEWVGLASASPVDQIATATGNGTAVSAGPVTTTTAGELVFGYGFVFNVASAGAGFTPLSLVNGDLDEYLIESAAGSVAATFTQNAGTWFAMMATFRPAGAAPVPPPTPPPTVSLTSPVAGTNVVGSVAVSAAASDAGGVAGVQFQLDGVNLGAEVTTSPYSISWDTTTVVDGSHSLTAIARNTAGLTTTSSRVAVTVSNGLASTGQWSAPFDLGIVAVNSVLLHTGKVLMFSGSYTSTGVERVWDPVTGTITLVPNPFSNLFCAGQAQLPDGRVMVVGGFDSGSLGASNASIFDPVAEIWSAAPSMAFRRWYPTATGLPDGRLLVTSGGQTCLTCLADLPEIYDPATGRFSTLATARLAVPYYPFMFVLPDGTVLDAGSNEQPVATSRLNLTTGSWSSVDPIVKDGHSAAMYLPGKILKSGTAADSGTTGVAAATAFVLDTTRPSPAWRQVASMAHARAFHNSTLLPDGTVLVTGGGSTLDGHDVTKAVFPAELWSPAIETWRTLASASVPRLYHSTALLLPDGRVLSAGSGNDSGAVDQTRGQIFSPPYLFKGARPAIASAPDVIAYGGSFSVQTPDAASIASVSLIRLGAVTHAFDEDQRFVSLAFTAAAGALSIQAPANANLAPPGYYMLFLVGSNGVPSVASFVRLPTGAADLIPPTAPGALTANGGLGSATLSWTASADNTGVALYNVHRSTTSGFAPSAANRIGQSTSTTFTDAGVAAGTYFYLVTAQDITGNVSDPSNEAVAIVLADATPPTVSITSPADQDAVSGSIAIIASAADDVGVAGVQFFVDGSPFGAERASPPYSITWNTATSADGLHTLRAVARDNAGNQAQASVTVSVSNTVPTEPPAIPPAQPGLVAAYGFNEGVGVLTLDSSGQANTGTIAGATWTTNGRFGSGLSFNGTNAWVTIDDSPSLDLTTGMTVEAWVNPSSATGSRTVLLKEAPGGLAYALYSAVSGLRPVGYVHTKKDASATGTTAVPVNTWTHLAFTFDGTTLKLYMNGALVRTSNINGSNSGAITTSAGALRIGGNAVFGEYFRGIIDEVRLYNRPLTAADIQVDMNTPIQ